MLLPLFLSMFLGIFGRPCCHIYNKDIAYKIISIFLFFVTFFSLRRLKKFQFLPCKLISCESYFLYNFFNEFFVVKLYCSYSASVKPYFYKLSTYSE